MTLTYSNYQSATGEAIPSSSTDRLPGQTETTAIIADIVASGGEFEAETGVTFSESSARHKTLLWKLVKRRFVGYRRDMQGTTVSEQTPVGTITKGDSVTSLDQLTAEINVLINRFKCGIDT